jgi:hypothetical protein
VASGCTDATVPIVAAITHDDLVNESHAHPSSSSTMPHPMALADWPMPWPPRTPRWRCCTVAASRVWAPPTWPTCATPWSATSTASSRWTSTFHTTRATCPVPGRNRRRRSGHRLALCAQRWHAWVGPVAAAH